MTLLSLWRGPTGRAADSDAALRRVGWRLAALTISLITVLLLVLGGAVYITTDTVMRQSLQTTILQRTAEMRSHPPGPDGHIPSHIGDVHFVFADQALRPLSSPDHDNPAAVFDATAARQVLAGQATEVWSTQQVDATGPYLIHTLPVSLAPPGGQGGPGVLQAALSEAQYQGGLSTLLDVLLGVSGAGLLAAGAISVALTRRALQPIEVAMSRQRDFVADAAHELRTPLTIQRAAMELGLSDDNLAQQQRAIEQALAQNVHLTRLVDHLSLLARADSGAVTLERQPVDLAWLARETASGVALIAEERGVRLRVEAARETRVLGDAGRLRQVLLILLDNALKYTPDDGAITVGVAQLGNQAQLEVRDSGPGIAAAALPRLFDRFYRADKARGSAGMGLGLAIGRWIAEAHGGHITAANAATPDHGAIFTVTLPLAST